MKIGFYGNTNNYPFMLARALRRLGHDVQFVVDQDAKLYRPENRYADIAVPYPDWIHDVSRMRYRDFLLPNARRREAVDVLRSCDAVVLNHYGPSLLSSIGRPALVALTGSDLVSHASYKEQIFGPGSLAYRLVAPILVAKQRAGIRNAKAVSFFWRGINLEGDGLLEKLGVGDDRRLFFLMTDTDHVQPTPAPNNSPLRIFCVCRFVWKKPIRSGFNRQDYKASDTMIRGLGLFCRRADVQLDIHFVRKGEDVEEAAALAEAEGLGPMITWHAEMTQSEVFEQYRLCDIVFDQMGNDSFVGMGGLDAMAAGRPLIANGRPEYMRLNADVPSPICHAETPEQVCTQLERLASSAEERHRVGNAGRAYVETYFSSNHCARVCVEQLEQFT
jgi:glycosyltransferase involved in cell wall biosynthesis